MDTTDSSHHRLPRRQVLQWFAAVAAAGESVTLQGFAQTVASVAAKGYGTDPDLTKFYAPGDVWPLTFSDTERKAVTALGDLILPADDFGPAASSLRVPDFVDEWVSAPYPEQQKDREVIIPGLAWIDEESQARFQKSFADLSDGQRKAICDDLCQPEQKDAKLRKAAAFFARFSGLCLGAYYATPEGWQAIGYVGNAPTGIFAGPPQEVLDRLGLEQTVKD